MARLEERAGQRRAEHPLLEQLGADPARLMTAAGMEPDA
jgi:hypothetical protein